MLRARIALTLSAWITGFLSLAYLLDPHSFDPVFRDKYLAHLPVVLLHGLSGVLALGLGPVLLFQDPLGQGWSPLRGATHRQLGGLYLGAVLVGGLSGLRLAGEAFGGTVGQTGFSLLAVLWLGTAWRAFALARHGHFADHRRWVARNYALTCSAVTLRALLSGGQMAGQPFEALYPWTAWLCWIPNLIAAEALLFRSSHAAAAPPSR